MDGERFDQVVRQSLGEASRRGVLRDGITVLAGSALVILGLSKADDAEARKKKKKKEKKKKRKEKKKGDPLAAGCQAGTKPCGSQCIPTASCCVNADCTGTDRCENGTCAALRCGTGGPCTVFALNPGTTNADLGGLIGADLSCQTAADGAGVNGVFMAWLSAGADSPSTRFTNIANAGPYRLVGNDDDGANPPPLVATSFADLTTCDGPSGQCLQNPINRLVDGTPIGPSSVWTGTQSNGTTGNVDDTCGGWTNGVAGVGIDGGTNAVNDDWTNAVGTTAFCTTGANIYCFQQA
jgi:hypothetical protein